MARKPNKPEDDWGDDSKPSPQSTPKETAKPVANDPRFEGLEHLTEAERERRKQQLAEHDSRMELIKSQTLALLTHSAAELERNNPQLVAFIREDERAKVLAEMAGGK